MWTVKGYFDLTHRKGSTFGIGKYNESSVRYIYIKMLQRISKVDI